MMDKEMCLYCAKYYPIEVMENLMGRWYCAKCYPAVYENVRKLPWNKGKPEEEWI